jgi:hypothetical protein
MSSSLNATVTDAEPWVAAAPFRLYVIHVMEASNAPWRVVAHHAGVPAAAIRTLLFGRGGHLRPKIEGNLARLLLTVTPENLVGLRCHLVDAELTRYRIAALRHVGLTPTAIARCLEIAQPTYDGLAKGRLGLCTAWVEALARAACEAHGVDPVPPAMRRLAAADSDADWLGQQVAGQASQFDRIDRVGVDGVSARPGRQPGVVGSADQEQDGWAIRHLVFDLLGQPDAPGWHGLAVEDSQINVTRVESLEDGRVGGDFNHLDRFVQTRQARAQREAHVLPHGPVIRIHKNRGRHLSSLSSGQNAAPGG